MKRRLSAIAVLTSLALGFGLAGQAGATTASGAAREAGVARTPAQVEEVQYRRGERHRDWRRGDRRGEWRDRRSHRDYRPRYRPPSGFYFRYDPPPVRRYVQPRRAYRLSQAHYNWCHARYRSYRAWDNTFQPYRGPRRQCLSPYA